jgi:flagellar biosynthesis component FlhA
MARSTLANGTNHYLPLLVTFFSISTTLVLFRGLSASIPSIVTLLLGFLVICVGLVLLHISKREQQEELEKTHELDRHSTLLVWSPTDIYEEKVFFQIRSG